MDPLLKGFIGLTSWLLYKDFRILCLMQNKNPKTRVLYM
jgi:hypothetical protein